MRAVLTGELCGWPSSRVSVFADRPRLGDLPDRLVRLFSDVRDVALFYYVGHGQVDPQDALCLSLADSQTEPARRKTTSLAFDQVRHSLSMSRASTKIVILDCCYAGIAAPGRLGADGVLELMRTAGTYTLAAAGEFSTAWFETGESVGAPQTYFTKYLLDVIERGIPGEGQELRLQQIFNEATELLALDSRPVPTSGATGHAPQLIFARNAASLDTEPSRQSGASSVAPPPGTLIEPSLRLAESGGPKAAADAQLHAPKAVATERARELARLKEQVGSTRPRTGEQQHELQGATSKPTRERDDTMATEAVARAAYHSPSARDEEPVSLISRPAPQQAQPQLRPQTPAAAQDPADSAAARAARNRTRRWLLAAAAVVVTAIGVSLSGDGGGQPAISLIAALKNPQYAPEAVAFAPDAKTLAVGSDVLNGLARGATYVWDLATRKITATLTDPGTNGVDSVAFGPDGALAAGDGNGSTYLWDLATGKITATLTEPGRSPVVSVAFGPDGTLAAGDWNGRTYLWDLATGKITATLTDPAARQGVDVDSLAFGPGAKTLAVGNTDDDSDAPYRGVTFVWDLATRKIIATLTDPGTNGVDSVAFGPDGALAAGDGNGSTYLWNLATRKITATLTDPGSSTQSTSVAFGPDRTLAAGDWNGRMYLWDLATGKITATLTEPGRNLVFSVAFGRDGTLAAGDWNGSTYLWNIPSHSQAALSPAALIAFLVTVGLSGSMMARCVTRPGGTARRVAGGDRY